MIQEGSEYELFHGDCIEHMAEMQAESMDFSVFSPPFPSLYAYTNSENDIGNSEDLTKDAKIHLGFFYRQLVRVMRPGRAVVVHVCQIPRMKRIDSRGGLFDFRGLNIRIGERAGLTYDYDWIIRKNPQSQAIRTKSRELQFSGLESDRARTRGTLGDYLIKFRAPGENDTPISDTSRSEDGEEITITETQVTRNNWIEWAECCWRDIRETETLNVRGTKGEGDTKHICPLQLEVIERCVKLFSNPGEIVFSPFAGIGSEGYVALKLGRRFYGCELKDEYHAQAIRNLDMAIRQRDAENQQNFLNVI